MLGQLSSCTWSTRKCLTKEWKMSDLLSRRCMNVAARTSGKYRMKKMMAWMLWMLLTTRLHTFSHQFWLIESSVATFQSANTLVNSSAHSYWWVPFWLGWEKNIIRMNGSAWFLKPNCLHLAFLKSQFCTENLALPVTVMFVIFNSWLPKISIVWNT